ncbi:hypothetical protein F8388_024145 [Cannabis sativa]|uniref:Dehydrin n=1 Tax=Cannabis sativa TaxID=3483 RepID=A0A7J6FXL4_CANSA|nr:hypothetical protein F8388_024145 [Cannabis sativa]KAF4383393.1 hypothetical protein G4B88_023967 [Cannabis sativa]
MADLLDEHGNPILLTDEQGNPVRLTDEHGNPVHLTGVATSRAAATEVGTGKGTHSTGPWNPRATTGYQATKTDTSWPHATAGTEHLANDPWSGTGGTGTGTIGTTTTTGHLGTEPWPHTATGGTGHHMEHHKGGMGLHDGGTGMEQHAPLGRVGMQCSEHHAPFKSSDAWVHGANPAGATDTRGAGFQPSKVDSERPKGESTTGLRRSGSSSSSSSEDDGAGGRRKKKGLGTKIKEKLTGKHKDEPTATTHDPTPLHEKKTVMEKIKEKLPGHHSHPQQN